MENYLRVNPETNEAIHFNSDGLIIGKGRFVSEEEIEKAQKRREAFTKKEASKIAPEYGGFNHFIGCFQKCIKDITPQLSLIECGILVTILAKMQKGKDGLLISGGKPMTNKDIEKHIKKGHTQTSGYLKKFTELGILEEIKKGKERNYRVNTQYHIMGEFPKLTEENRFTKLYKAKLYEMIDTLSLKELGFIYKALPICHYNTFYLAHNPNAPHHPYLEKDSVEASRNVDLELFNRKELADYMNVDVDNITKTVNSLSKKGLIMTSTTSRVTSYRLHPHIVHPKGIQVGTYILGICHDFETHRENALHRSKRKKT